LGFTKRPDPTRRMPAMPEEGLGCIKETEPVQALRSKSLLPGFIKQNTHHVI